MEQSEIAKRFGKFVHPASLLHFSHKGESMSDAQNMKGKCTQISESVKATFTALGPVKETIIFDGSPVSLTLPKVMTAAELEPFIGKDARANALNGWYAQAIDAKNVLMAAIDKADVRMFLEDGEKLEPEMFDEKFTEHTPTFTLFDDPDVIATWSPNDLADYLVKEQYCATVGKLIHKSGKLHDLYNTPLSQTTRFEKLENGEKGAFKAYPVTVVPAYAASELEDMQAMYIKKHDEHRETEKKVNWYKAKLKNELAELNSAKQLRYSEAMQVFNKKHAEYAERRQTYLNDVRNKNSALTAKCQSRRQLLKKEASNLKIFIPEALRPIKKLVEEFMM